MMNTYIQLAGHRVELRLRLPGTAVYFDADPAPGTPAEGTLYVSDDDLARHRQDPDRPFNEIEEYSLMIAPASRFLLERDAVVFHGVAVLLDGRAWLLTARSGVGKTTQYLLMKRLFGPRVELICGDKPILGLDEEGELRLYPSPWKGKERLDGEKSGRLCGTVLLRQEQSNRFGRLTPRTAALSLYPQLLYSPETEDQARSACNLLERLMRLPMLEYGNTGDEASARLLFKTLTQEEKV